MKRLLVVEDCPDTTRQIASWLGGHYRVLLANNVQRALSIFTRYLPKVILLALSLPSCDDGSEEVVACLEKFFKVLPLAKVILITENEGREEILRAARLGAYDFCQKPISLDELKFAIKRAFHFYSIEEENHRLRSTTDKEVTAVDGMIGKSSSMLEIFSLIRKIAPSNMSVLIKGESGTGKELVAQAIHSLNMKKNGSFVQINCPAIPETLLESELFGYEKGSFTGAYSRVQGKVEYAHNGTLFLDEIGELPTQLQVKLLRFLQEKTIQRIGGRENIYVDARIIAATNKDILKATDDGKFRKDLYYRIGAITINLPALRERKDDIMPLANFFLRKFSRDSKKTINGINSSAIEALKAHPWPGNVRELENRIQRAVIMSESRIIEPHDLGLPTMNALRRNIGGKGKTLRETRDKTEREMIISVFERQKGNLTRTAKKLGVSRPTLYSLMKKHDIQ